MLLVLFYLNGVLEKKWPIRTQSNSIKGKVMEYGLAILNYLNKLHSKWTLSLEQDFIQKCQLVTESIQPKYGTNETVLRFFIKLVFTRDFVK